MGDLDGNGCAGDIGDLAIIDSSGGFVVPCTANKGCYGDANADGEVDEYDLDFIDAILAANNYLPLQCPFCSACRQYHEWCQGDINCDGVVDQNDFDELFDLLDEHGAFTCRWDAPGCTPSGSCP